LGGNKHATAVPAHDQRDHEHNEDIPLLLLGVGLRAGLAATAQPAGAAAVEEGACQERQDGENNAQGDDGNGSLLV